MRASDLIGKEVRSANGARLGVVTDLRCAQASGRSAGLPALTVTELIVSRRHTGSLLGYDRRRQQGPWLVRIIIQRLHRHAVLISYTDTATITADSLTLKPHAHVVPVAL